MKKSILLLLVPGFCLSAHADHFPAKTGTWWMFGAVSHMSGWVSDTRDSGTQRWEIFGMQTHLPTVSNPDSGHANPATGSECPLCKPGEQKIHPPAHHNARWHNHDRHSHHCKRQTKLKPDNHETSF